MTRPDDLDLAQARVTQARARLTQSTEALQSQLQPRALARTLADEASARRRPLAIGSAGLVVAIAAAAIVTRALKRRRAARVADPAAHARQIDAVEAKPATDPRVRLRGRRKKR